MTSVPGVHFTLPAPKGAEEILSTPAVEFLTVLHRTFDKRRKDLLEARKAVQAELDKVGLPSFLLAYPTTSGSHSEERKDLTDFQGKPLTFLPETADVRSSPSWSCAPPAPGLEDRRVEITGPTDRKMVINALNSGAKTFMADFEGESATRSEKRTGTNAEGRLQLANMVKHGPRTKEPL